MSLKNRFVWLALLAFSQASFATLPTYPAKNDVIFGDAECRISIDSLGKGLVYTNDQARELTAYFDTWMPQACREVLQQRRDEIAELIKTVKSPKAVAKLRELILLTKPRINPLEPRPIGAPSSWPTSREDGGAAR